MKEHVIHPDTVLRDRRGVDWKPTADFQDRDATALHWLELRSDRDEVMSFGDVIMHYGMDQDALGQGGRLTVVIDGRLI